MQTRGFVLAVAMLTAGAVGTAAFDASASTLTPLGSSPAATWSAIQPAAMVVKKKVVKKNGNVTKKVWVYDRGRHGVRYRARRPGYGYYYGGYYYSKPWWTPGINLCIGC